MLIRFYDVTYDSSAGVADLATEGFLDTSKVWLYDSFNGPRAGGVSGTDYPSAASNNLDGIRKAKGFYRWVQVLRNLTDLGFLHDFSLTADNGDAATISTNVQFRIGFMVTDDQSASSNPEDIYTYDETTGNVLTGQDAIERALARPLATEYKKILEVYNGTLVNTFPTGVEWQQTQINSPDAGADLSTRLANVITNNITVTEVANINP